MPLESRKVLITGGAGFIGSHLAEAHLACGDRVWIVDNLSTGRQENVPSDTQFHLLDIASEEAAALIRRVGFDVVSHQAAQADVRVSVADPMRDARTNILGLLNVLEAVAESGAGRVVFASSGGVVYGEADEVPTPEGALKRPASPYGVAKLAGERYLDYYRQVRGVEHVALRYANVYGPRQDPGGEAGVVAIFGRRLLEGRPLRIFGDGGQTRDYVHVADVVAANLLAAEAKLSSAPGADARAYNVGSGIETSVNELADILERGAGAQCERLWDEARPGELRRSALATAKIRALGWRPEVALRDGVGGAVATPSSAQGVRAA